MLGATVNGCSIRWHFFAAAGDSPTPMRRTLSGHQYIHRSKPCTTLQVNCYGSTVDMGSSAFSTTFRKKLTIPAKSLKTRKCLSTAHSSFWKTVYPNGTSAPWEWYGHRLEIKHVMLISLGPRRHKCPTWGCRAFGSTNTSPDCFVDLCFCFYLKTPRLYRLLESLASTSRLL